jgi:hypothetical protein
VKVADAGSERFRSLDTPCDNSYKIVTIAHGSTYLYDPLGGSYDESIEFFEHRPATRLSPASALNSFGARCTARYGLMATPIVRGTSGSLVFVVQQVDRNANNTITCAGMLAGQVSVSLDSQPHEMRQEFVYNAGNSENIAPLTIAIG